MSLFECVNCSNWTESERLEARCGGCGSALLLSDRGIPNMLRAEIDSLPPGVWRFAAALPRVRHENIVSLGEGATPLLRAERLGSELGFTDLLIKDETRNPTGSFIDRGSTILVSLAKERGVKRMSCITTGNLGASLAAYAARAGIETQIRIHPKTDHGKLYQMIAYGARVEILSEPTTLHDFEPDSTAVSAGNAFILEGEKTTGFEIIQDMNWTQPEAIILPVGTGGHMTMVWRALAQLHGWRLIDPPTCKLVGVQLRASAPIVEDFVRKRPRRWDQPFTELEESEPIFKKTAIKAIRDSRGCGIEVSAREAVQATTLLARTEGIFAEPASASVVASLMMLKENGALARDERIVCVITGAGLKDTEVIRRMARTRKHMIARDELLLWPQMGQTKLKLMRSLAGGPRFGYDLWKELSKRNGITTASVYQHLSELEATAQIRRSRTATIKGRERIFYELTKKGTELLRALGEATEAST